MKINEDAVSPVVGVMLMLVVTIIIAAVVSGFAGGITADKSAAPTVTMDVSISNTGRYASSIFEAKVLSVSEPISTKDLKLTTSWTASDGTSGGAVCMGGASNVFGWASDAVKMLEPAAAPWGYGAGVSEVNTGNPNKEAQQFGNYTLIAGTVLRAMPIGASGGYGGPSYESSRNYGAGTLYEYTGWTYQAGTRVDGMQAVLGNGWEKLRSGDTVSVSFTHVPSGRVIYQKNVAVE